MQIQQYIKLKEESVHYCYCNLCKKMLAHLLAVVSQLLPLFPLESMLVGVMSSVAKPMDPTLNGGEKGGNR